MCDRERRERLVDGEVLVDRGEGRQRDRANGRGYNYSSRSAVTTGRRAARIAGSMPPSSPMIIA